MSIISIKIYSKFTISKKLEKRYFQLVKKESGSSENLEDLLKFWIEYGDVVPSEHLETCYNKAKYTSHRIQNELIVLCGIDLW